MRDTTRPYPLYCSQFFFFFFNDTATTEIYTLSLHDALPISAPRPGRGLDGHPALLLRVWRLRPECRRAVERPAPDTGLCPPNPAPEVQAAFDRPGVDGRYRELCGPGLLPQRPPELQPAEGGAGARGVSARIHSGQASGHPA